jgi:hypothetical protein
LHSLAKMDGNSHQDYLHQEDVSYDELMSNAGWPVAAGDQFAFPPAPPQQAPYNRYSTSQPAFNQYQQPSYPISYTTSPYTSQYQHGAPSDVYVPNPYTVDPSLQNSAVYHDGPGSSFSFAPQESATISPHSLQYHVPSNQPIHGGVSNAVFQPQGTNYTQSIQEPPAAFFRSTQNAPVQQDSPVQYATLTNSSLGYASKPSAKAFREVDVLSNPPQAQQMKPEPKQSQLRITHPELYAANSTSSGPRFENAPYLALSGAPIPVLASIKGQYIYLW